MGGVHTFLHGEDLVVGEERNTGVSPLRRAMKLHAFGRDDVRGWRFGRDDVRL
jgi:hypothetical protein